MNKDYKDINKNLSVGFIGAGKVGFSLGKFFSEGNVRVTGYYSKHAESAKEAATFTGTKCFESLSEIVLNSDALFLTVPDGEISSVFQSIKDLNIAEKFICHTSGAMSSKEAFPDIESTNATGYSIHPLFPISSKYESYKELSDAFFCLEGDSLGIDIFKDMLENLSVRTRIINASDKPLYHGACVFASNLICGVIKQSIDMLNSCGFNNSEAISALEPLILSNINHIIDVGPVNALTGPIERNDITTINKHLDSLKNNDEKMLYKYLSLKTLECALIKNADKDYKELNNILKS